MSFAKLQLGDVVLSADGSDLGGVSEISETCFRLDTKHKRDQWVPGDAIANRESGIALLRFPKDSLKDAVIDIEQHRGLHSHKPLKSEGGGPGAVLTPLLILGGIVLFLRDKERREQVMSTAKKAIEQVKYRLSRGNGEPQSGSNYGGTSTLGSMPSTGADYPRPDTVEATRSLEMPPGSPGLVAT